MDRPQAMKQLLREMMAAKLDSYMSGHGFRRRTAAIEYRRTIGDTRQTVEMTMSIGPHYHPGAHAHIYPFLQITIPGVNRVALGMLPDQPPLGRAADITLREPIELTAPPQHRVLWYATDQVSFMDLGDPIREFVDRWVIGFLDEHAMPEGIVRAYEAGDTGTMGDGFWLIHVAACYVLLNKPEAAYRLLEARFKGIHTRREYAKAFDYVRALLPPSSVPGEAGG